MSGIEKNRGSAIGAIIDNNFLQGATAFFTMLGIYREESISLPLKILIISIGVIYILYQAYQSVQKNNIDVLPAADGIFSPFPSLATWKVWPRKKITEQLANLIEQNDKRHVLLIAPSGAGKSVLINDLLPKSLPDYECRIISSYENPIETILFTFTENRPTQTVATQISNLLELSREKSPDLPKIAACMEGLLKNEFEFGKIAFLFDQVERYFFRFDGASNTDYRKLISDSQIIQIILHALRDDDRFRTLFGIRSEYAFKQLNSLFTLSPDGLDIDQHIDFYFLWGVNKQDDLDLYLKLSSDINRKIGNTSVSEKIFRVSNYVDQAKASTFLLNLCGYVYEKLHDDDRYKASIDESDDGDQFIDIYLTAAFNGFTSSHPSIKKSVFDSTLFALASETKSSGEACDCQRLSGLAHYPSAEVKAVLDYLETVGIILPPEMSGGLRVYRLAHDKLMERILGSDNLAINSDAIDGIRYLTENATRTDHLKIPTYFPKFIENTKERILNWSNVPVAIFWLFGLTRLSLPEYVRAFPPLSEVYDFIASFRFIGQQEYYLSSIYYLPTFAAHVIWISYIDRVNRAIIQNIGTPRMRILGNVLPWIGVISGIVFAYSPQMIAIPLACVTALYAPILVTFGYYPNFGNHMKSMMKLWGLRTLLNVFILSCVTLFLAPFLDERTNITAVFSVVSVQLAPTFRFAMISCEALVLYWFWQHIRPEQDSPRSWSGILALYDKGRIHTKPTHSH